MPRFLLAQLPGQPPVSVPSLPAPPALPHYLFEVPLVPAASLLIAAAVAFSLLNRAGRARQAVLVAATLALGAVALYLTASLVTTERELLQQRTATLVDATARADTAALGRLLAPDATLTVMGFPGPYDRDRILREVEDKLGSQFPIREHRVTRSQAVVDGPNLARTQVRVWAEPRNFYPGGSWWRVDWRKEPAGEWLVTAIDCLQLDGRSAGARPD